MMFSILLTALGCAVFCIWGKVLPAIAMLALLTAFALRAHRLSETDALTGLGNLHRLQRLRRHFLRFDAIGVVFLDLDHLKAVNDALGHAKGDDLLQEMGRALRQAGGHGTHIFRVGGDEFLAVMKEAELMPFLTRWGLRRLPSPVSLGHAVGPGRDLDLLLRQADEAMYRSRSSGHSSAAFPCPPK